MDDCKYCQQCGHRILTSTLTYVKVIHQSHIDDFATQFYIFCINILFKYMNTLIKLCTKEVSITLHVYIDIHEHYSEVQ